MLKRKEAVMQELEEGLEETKLCEECSKDLYMVLTANIYVQAHRSGFYTGLFFGIVTIVAGWFLSRYL